MKDLSLREILADLCHDQWSGWMKYLFSKCEPTILSETNEKALIIPLWAVERWQRQMNTLYQDLPKEEKDSDRKEADRFIRILRIHKRLIEEDE